MTIFVAGLGIQTKSSTNEVIDVYFPKLVIGHKRNKEGVDNFLSICESELGYNGGNKVINLDKVDIISFIQKLDSTKELPTKWEARKDNLVIVILETDKKVETVEEAYLKLHLLSHRLAKPHDLNLDGIFKLLPTVAWTNEGAVAIYDLPSRQLKARAQGKVLSVDSVDKFPKMTDYVVPSGVRIADTSRVRLGAYIGEGSTIMHEGFVNFNAGTEGPSMIEGRISAGVFVGKGSDLGGGCSTMGTLSGGGNIIISVGQDSLIGANAGIGISLGDRCIVESGLYITAGIKVTLLDEDNNISGTVKARDLSGKSDLLFRRNSQNGKVECLTNKSAVELNEELHANN